MRWIEAYQEWHCPRDERIAAQRYLADAAFKFLVTRIMDWGRRETEARLQKPQSSSWFINSMNEQCRIEGIIDGFSNIIWNEVAA